MLLTITYFGENAADLGYLLHKNPFRAQSFGLGFGKAYIFYPEVSQNRCTAALLLDIDPLDLARGKAGSKTRGLFDYVNDRPYVSSSFMSVAVARTLRTAMTGKCEMRQELADTALDFEVSLTTLPCRADTNLLLEIFEPLGYEVKFAVQELDECFPEWGKSHYVDLTLRGKQKLKDILCHLYVLIPVFDKRKHYYMDDSEVDKLLENGKGWLEDHPKKALITLRYFNKIQRFTQVALDRLDNGEGFVAEALDESEEQVRVSLNTRRLETVIKTLKMREISSVIDLGCGEGNLLKLLIKEKQFTKIAGTDVSLTALERAKEKLRIEKLSDAQRSRISLFQSSVTYRDSRFAGYDAIVAVEVIEHLDENRLGAFSEVIFGTAKSKTVIITTPNVEYNQNYAGLSTEHFRHGDHRFEWNRKQFHDWAEKTAEKYGYKIEYEDIGDTDEHTATPTQMGVFTLCE